MNPSNRHSDGWSDGDFDDLEGAHPEGLGMQGIVEAVTAKGDRLTEATFRKYVQLGLLPRSVRVGRKGKHRGSQGLYPATTVRQIVHLRRLMAQGFTIEEIQREFLFVRGDIEALERQLERVFSAIEAAVEHRGEDDIVARSVTEARALGAQLLATLESVERRLSTKARMERAVV
ncbi:MAG: hypothetical protein KC416_12265 [Myxococcales bacterium]|nr:hypothetical protein [Myxococcales bacterium]